MNRLRRTFSFRKRKKQNRSEAGDSSKPQQWLDDEVKIKEGFCSFQVKYLGNIEVYESRGMQVCEEAIKALRKSKKKPQKAVLSVSGDALRVSDDVSQHLIVDQTIEKVSFCAPDRNHEKGFAYICRDGATRRWMCHAFLAVKESGERLSHAVGCAFAICLEKKQRRERDALQLEASDDRPIFTRVGSFRPATLAERLLDPQSTITADPVPQSHNSSPTSSTIMNRVASPVSHVGAIPRPHASPSIIERQGSLRIFPKLQENSPFKRDLSLRLEGVPSNLRRLTGMIQGAPIAEEPDTDFEPIKPGVFSKTDEQRGKIESVTTSSTHNWSQFKVASSSFNFPVLNGSPAAAQFTSGHYFDSRTSQAAQTTASVITSTPTSPFLGGPPIAAPSVSTTFNPNSWVVTYPQTQQFNRSTIQHNVISSNSHITGTMNSASNLGHPTNGVLKSIPIVSSGSTNNPWSMGLNDTNNGTWQTSPALSPPLLPPEPDCLSDPFDLGWVDRATAVVPTSIVGGRDIMSNPFLITNGDGSNILQQNTSMHN
ncbi:Protein numb [Schistosoma japonicum]|nr:Protein numb [Schistosoma japonicum]KAH8861370.1 Protein numb [Schistosoma japonicum]